MGQAGWRLIPTYKLNVAGNNAWVSHDEESTAKDGKTYSPEFRILDKVDNHWKLAGQSIRAYTH